MIDREALRQHGFADPRRVDEEGVVAVGGPMSVERLLVAYRNGIFPWSGDPVRWHCPDPRAIFWRVRLPRKLGKMMRRGRFEVTFDADFAAVIRACRRAHVAEGEWISDRFVSAYSALHDEGFAHSVEVWQEGELVGGLYGVQLRGLFAGESMFYRVSNASKVGFAHLVWHLQAIGVVLLDCQMITPITYQLGAILVRRADYLRLLRAAMAGESGYAGRRWPRAGAPAVAEQASEYAAKGNPA